MSCGVQAAVRAALRWRKAKVSAALNKWLYVADQGCFDADANSVYQQYALMKAAEGLKHWRKQTICESPAACLQFLLTQCLTILPAHSFLYIIIILHQYIRSLRKRKRPAQGAIDH